MWTIFSVLGSPKILNKKTLIPHMFVYFTFMASFNFLLPHSKDFLLPQITPELTVTMYVF